MEIQGLEQNGYLIDNPIIVTVTGGYDVEKLEVTFYNQQNGKTSGTMIYYPNPDNEVVFDVAEVVKALFTEPKHNTVYNTFATQTLINNSNKFSINFNLVYYDDQPDGGQMQRTFIRGGKYTQETNQRIPANTLLTVTERIPIWAGYPSAYYTLDNEFKVKKNSLAQIETNVQLEYLREKTCEGKYLKFLNSLGGYSYWLFDNFEIEDSNDNLGIVNNGFDKKDLGNTCESSFKVMGKIPERFYPLMRDLIMSKEIYSWDKENQVWKRLVSDKNKWTANGASVAYKIEYKFNEFSTYNPKL